MERVAFYPCCAQDIRKPAELLTGIVDEIIYCDISPSLRDDPLLAGNAGPKRTFWKMDVREALVRIPHIDVLFYRGDSAAEGGSGIFLLGKHLFPIILEKMTSGNGLIVTDGSNSRGGTFRKMKRNSGLIIGGKHITLRPEQRFGALDMLEFDVQAAS